MQPGKTALILVLFCCYALTGLAADAAHHSLINLLPKSKLQEEQILTLGLDRVPGESKSDLWVAALPHDLEKLQREGLAFEVLIPDMEAYFARRARREGHLDDMGGFKTFTEIEAALDQIHTDHPDITTAKFSIGNTFEGNPIWCMKISDNPEVDEDEIELFFNSLTHAREPAAMEALFVFFDHLTDNYSSGSGNEATTLVDNREFYWIPCVNPDGYLYNEATNSDGGGMWRKNRRDNGDGSYGVDLNRNFGFNWGYDNSGSSPTSFDETYRGTGAFSEPETQGYRDFVEARNFVLTMNYHTYSNLILYPWGTESYDSGHTPEHDIFTLMADSMAYYIQQVNGAVYATGTAWELLYNVNGDANDWCYGEQTTKNRIFGFTPEVGSVSDNFWPAPSRIMPLALENLPSNLFVSRYAEILVPADQYAKLNEATFSEDPGDGDGIIESGEDIGLAISIKNIGNLDLAGMNGELTSASPFVTIPNDLISFSDSSPGDTTDGLSLFTATILPGIPEPFGVDFLLHLTATSGLDTTYSIRLVVGPPILAEDFETGAPGWTHEAGEGGWLDQWHSSTERSHSSTTSYKCGDTGAGDYGNDLDARLISPVIVDLPDEAVLSFWSDIDAERSGLYPDSAYDGGVVEISVDGGAFFSIAPATGYTHTFRWFVGGSTPYEGPMPGQPCFSGLFPWRQYEFDLSAYAGQDIQIRFRFGSDGVLGNEGWYVDDVIVTGIRPVTVVVPTGLTVQVIGNDLILRWDEDINPMYSIYSSGTPDGDFSTYVGSTADASFTILNGFAGSDLRFYVVVGAMTVE